LLGFLGACAPLAVAAALTAAIGCSGPRAVAVTASTLAGADTLTGVDWLRVPAPADRALFAAVARPAGQGPFPVLVFLHGTHGFAREYVRLARDLAREAGLVTVAGCWFAAGQGAGTRFVTSLDCPDAPAMPAAATAEALGSVGALVAAARALPGVRPDRVAILGQSRGGGAALHYVLERGGVRAAVLNSTGYPPEVVDRAGEVSAPLLIVHGTADNPADGGSARTAIERARAFEAALRAAGRPVEVLYFEGGRHNGLFADSAQYDATLRRIATFLRSRLFN